MLQQVLKPITTLKYNIITIAIIKRGCLKKRKAFYSKGGTPTPATGRAGNLKEPIN